MLADSLIQRKADDHTDNVKKARKQMMKDDTERYRCPPAWVEMGRQPKLKESEAESNGASGLFLDVTK